MGRILAIDYGLKRTGIAVTDSLKIIASGLTTVKTHELLAFLKDYIQKEDIEKIIIGLPKQMNNQPSETELHIIGFIKKLIQFYPKNQIERIDERFTSKMAQQSMIDSGLKKKQRQNKALIDEISATIILQTYLSK